MKEKIRIESGSPYPVGVNETVQGVQFAVPVKNAEKCYLNLYRHGGKVPEMKIEMSDKNARKFGDVFFVSLSGERIAERLEEEYEYTYECNKKEFVDPYARKVIGREEWGSDRKQVRGGFQFVRNDTLQSHHKPYSYYEYIIYQMHVRGFTKHTTSKVKSKGTFLGIIEKIPYLKELGINCVMLLPCYEFNEVVVLDEYAPKPTKKTNYWGYTKEAFYFSPKASYAADGSKACEEFRAMVDKLHENGIEVMMDMFFSQDKSMDFILDVLRYWAWVYHVDGFRINLNIVRDDVVARDPVLRDKKLIGTSWEHLGRKEQNTNLAECNEGFLIDARRFLKSDEGQTNLFYNRMKYKGNTSEVINFIASVNGFTLMDLVSYDIKHNENNDEKNQDGTEFNYSWNCGVEGTTRKKAVLQMRRKQVRNALILLFLSQGIPMFLSGDEFLNSQKGNNNAYCQDNALSWLDWSLLEKNHDIFDYVKMLIQLRKAHPVFHKPEVLQGMDYISCGLPDVSAHGIKPWSPDFSNYSRVLSILLCGKYVKIKRKSGQYEDNSFYLAYNMHWEKHVFYLPRLCENKKWKVFIDTAKDLKELKLSKDNSYELEPRSIVVFMSED